MISFDEAVARVCGAARPLGTETVAIEQAAGRILASSVLARIDGPRADVSTMDGYAVRDADLRVGAELPVIGEAFPGAPFGQALPPGTCLRIFTGAPVPEGADRVVMQENVSRTGDNATFTEPASAVRFLRRRGSDFAIGDALVHAGQRLGPRALVAAAAADVDAVEVYRRPRLVILCTGDELARPGQAAATDAAVPESLSVGLTAFAEQCGAQVIAYRQLADDLPSMKAEAAASLDAADIVVVTGGASVGERDFAKAMFEGLDLIFSKVAIKPGKPVWLGRAGGRIVMGLPGNPTSALVTARLLLQPLLTGMGGGNPDAALRWRPARLAVPMEAGSDRETFWRAREEAGRVVLMPNQDSGAQRTLAEADLLVRQLSNAPALATDAQVDVLDF